MNPTAQTSPALCQHFERCGGCQLQHLSLEDYYAQKERKMLKLADSLGVSPNVIQPLVKVGLAERRRAQFKIRRRKENTEIGFFEAQSHDLVNVQECPVSKPELLASLNDLRNCLQAISKKRGFFAFDLTLTETGLDGLLHAKTTLTADDKLMLKNFAKHNQFARLTVMVEDQLTPLYLSETPIISLSNIRIELPINAFLQATTTGQREITQRVVKHLSGSEQLLDLYAGCGSYSFALQPHARHVSAFEGAETMVAAMVNAAMGHDLDTKLKASVRDLYKRPLRVKELNLYDGAVINPPRNGALPQIEHLAKSEIKKIVYVSCNPDSFRRDAQHLLAANYQLTSLTAIDQFIYSGHLELVAMFDRG